MLAQESIGKLLISGIFPGLILAGAYLGIVYGMVKLHPDWAPVVAGTVSFREKLTALKGVWETVAIFLLVIGGIYFGIFTPNEAAGVGATILFLIAVIKRKLTGKTLLASLYETLRISVMVLFLVAAANVFSYFLALSMIPMKVSAWIIGLGVSRYVVLLIIIAIYLLLGCFLDAISMMVLTLPVILPVMATLKFDPIWFGVVCVIMMEAGLITPPMGLNVFTVAAIAKDTSLEEIFKGALPFLIAMLFVTFLITLFSQIALYFPGMMGR